MKKSYEEMDAKKRESMVLGLVLGLVLLILLVISTFTGCGVELGTEKQRDLAYTVVAQDEVPEPLWAVMEEKKGKVYKETFCDGEYLYIAKSYGAQESSGYAITVEALYSTENSVHFKTRLSWTDTEETQNASGSYPIIVIKTEQIEEPVVFD